MRRAMVATLASASMALMICLSVAAPPVLGQGSRSRNTVIGTWTMSVTRESAPEGQPLTFPALISFLPGRAVIETEDDSSHGTPGHGIWKFAGNRQFEAEFTFLRAGPEGQNAGTQRSTLSITLAASGNAFDATVLIEIFDRDGNVVSTTNATAQGQRMRGAGQ